MNELHKSYSILGLSPGTSMDLINRRYKSLVLKWHPDRFRSEESKATAERELKAINNARDILRDHFSKGAHNLTGTCHCQSDLSQTTAQAKQGAGPSGHDYQYAKTDDCGEQSARSNRKTSEGHHRQPEEEHEQNAQQAPPAGPSFHNACRRDGKPANDVLRWKTSKASAIVFAILIGFSVVSDAMAQTFLSAQRVVDQPSFDPVDGPKLSEVWNSYQADKAKVAYSLLRRESTPGETSRWKPPFSSNVRSADALSQMAYQEYVVRTQQQQKQSDQERASAGIDVERYQRAIEFSTKKLAELELTLADPNISILDRKFATSSRATQLEFLTENQGNLKYAQEHLKQLQEPGAVDDFNPPPAVSNTPSPTLKSILENINMDPVVLPGGQIKPGSEGFLDLSNGLAK